MIKEKELVDQYGEEFVEEVFDYLEELRESGVTNMWGASSYIEEEFELQRRKGRPFLTAWMESYN